MKEQLVALGFKFESSCNCHGETSFTYSFPGNVTRMEVSSRQVWVKGHNGVRWASVDFGNSDRFQEFLTKYYGL